MTARDIPEDRFPPADVALRPAHEDRQVAQLRVPPHSLQAEEGVLGGLLIDNRAWDLVGDLLTEADFYRYEHRLIYGAIGGLVLAGRPADVITVYDALQGLGKGEEVGGMAYLNALAQKVPSASAIRRHAEIVREKAVLRRLIATADAIATRAFNPQGQTLDSIVDEAEAQIMAVAEAQGEDDDFKPMETYVVQALERIQRIAMDPDAESDYIPTGIGAWDDAIDGGMRGGEQHVVAARPGHGKSAALLTVACNVASFRRAGKRVGDVAIFSMEMPGLQWANRAIAQLGRVHLSKIKRPERLRETDWPGITEGVELLREKGIHLNDKPARTINHVRSAARRLARRTKLALIGIDYLGLMPGLDPRMPRTYQIEQITQGLKNLAKELDVPVMLLVQLKRSVDEKPDQMPTLADLRDSGAIEQDADTITFIQRPFQTARDLGDEWRPYARGLVAKGRDSEGGLFDMHYEGPQLHFTDWPTDMEVPTSTVRVARASRGGGKQL